MTKESKFHHSCSANQQNVTLHVKHDHQYRRNFKPLNIIWCIICFYCIYWDTRYQEIRPPFSMLNAKRFEIIYVLHHHYIMYSNVKTPQWRYVTTSRSMDFVPTGHRPNKSRHFYQAGDNISYLRVDPWALRLYHPEALLYSLRRSRGLYSGAEGWCNLNANRSRRR
jgi:hypothetical protein